MSVGGDGCVTPVISLLLCVWIGPGDVFSPRMGCMGLRASWHKAPPMCLFPVQGR